MDVSSSVSEEVFRDPMVLRRSRAIRDVPVTCTDKWWLPAGEQGHVGAAWQGWGLGRQAGGGGKGFAMGLRGWELPPGGCGTGSHCGRSTARRSAAG